MGIDLQTTKYLIDNHVIKGSVLTIGRQALFGENEEYASVLGISVDAFTQIRAKSDGLAEGLLEHLGASRIDSLDYSDYEGATLLHDLNSDIPTAWINKYDTVLDAGTLEHIFNYPMALWSCMRMVKVGGLLMLVTPTNNLCNHGFYQISPELIFRTFSSDNGFRLIECSLRVEDGNFRSLPDHYGVRNEIPTTGASYLYAIGRKELSMPMFTTYPQQSDYLTQWSK